jgi:DNA-binding NarL/FixJ family response regulator
MQNTQNTQTLEQTRTINVFIVDDSEIVRDRLTSMLTEVSSINIIGYADNDRWERYPRAEEYPREEDHQ